MNSAEMRKERLKSSSLYLLMKKISVVLDKYYLDGVIGFLPYGIGDVVAAMFSCVHIYFSSVKLRSLALTLAIINNALRDIFLGLLPFFIGDVIDFLHQSNKRNMILIDGFINNDAFIISKVKREAWKAALTILALIVAIAALLMVVFKLTAWLLSFLLSGM